MSIKIKYYVSVFTCAKTQPKLCIILDVVFCVEKELDLGLDAGKTVNNITADDQTNQPLCKKRNLPDISESKGV